MNKTNEILRYLKENGSITSWEAINEFGATRLSAVIYNLRHRYGLEIISEDIEFIDRYGSKSHFAKYTLVENEKN